MSTKSTFIYLIYYLILMPIKVGRSLLLDLIYKRKTEAQTVSAGKYLTVVGTDSGLDIQEF